MSSIRGDFFEMSIKREAWNALNGGGEVMEHLYNKKEKIE